MCRAARSSASSAATAPANRRWRPAPTASFRNFSAATFPGSVRVFGDDTAGRPVAGFAGTIGMVLQDFESQLFSTTVQSEIAFVMENLGIPPATMRERAAFWLSEMGLAGFETREPASLSGGQKQRLALASVMAADTPMLILDEPTTDLDPLSAAAFAERLARLAHAENRTVILITHDLDLLERADAIAVMDEGRIVRCAPAREILSDAAFLEGAGVRPPQIADLFARLGAAENSPRNIDDAEKQLHGLGLAPKKRPKRRPRGGGELAAVRSARFGYKADRPVLDGVDLTIRGGEFVALLGQNGSGKSTLARLVCGVHAPWSGGALLGGAPVASLSAADRTTRVGLVFQKSRPSDFFAPRAAKKSLSA
ncbi:MAG: ATP-binding cassette domain-containing protein [Deltaproteobacteria bacterium]|nr:ATP-binding cassette domain-containing protein [Deltaproteobacteria bacterium]